jgi:hypothetical protein
MSRRKETRTPLKGGDGQGRRFPFERTFFPATLHAMDAHTKITGKSSTPADVLSERVIFWGMISTSIVISIAMLKGMLGYG